MRKGSHIDTAIIHAGEGVPVAGAPVTTPIYTATTFAFPNAAELEAFQQGRSEHFLYTRYANPTVQAAEAKIAAAEGAEAAMVTGSGMAATSTALFGLLQAGDELVCASSIYGGTLQVMSGLLAKFGVTTRFLSLEQMHNLGEHLHPSTRVVWFESPTNPTLRCLDIRRIADACRARGVVTVMDNTFASPINQQPLSLGIDLVMHSATKFLNGHSDVTAGALVGSRALIGQLLPARKLLGGVLEPASAYALSRGIKTLGVRMARQNATAQHVAEWLEAQPGVARVLYPGLTSHPEHALAAAQMRGFGAMICIDLRGGYDAAVRAYDRLSVFQRAASLGGVESLCSIPVLTSQYGLSDEQLADAGVTRGMLRLSIGLEDPGDLIADLTQALA